MTRLHNLHSPIKKDQIEGFREQFQDLQGNILKGFGKKNSYYVFLEFQREEWCKAQAQQWIRGFSSKITSAQHQIDDRKQNDTNRICRSLFISAKGYEYFSLLDFRNLQRPFKDDEAFCFGMKSAINQLNDPFSIEWEEGYQKTVHAMILLSCNNIDQLNNEQIDLVSSTSSFSTVCSIEYGQVLFKDGKYVEPFGYADGISFPIFFEDDLPKEEIVWRPGPGAGPALALVPDPYGRQDRSPNGLVTQYHHSGSYVVFRKLRQDVEAFNKRLVAFAHHLGLSSEEAAARIVGRYQNGTPLLPANTASPHDLNNFNYQQDREGAVCPLSAHIRQMNPRDNNNVPRIVRRGIPYDDNARSDAGGVGLLFMCYQNNIASHFQRLQKWANEPGLPQPRAGFDSITAQPVQARRSSRGAHMTFYDLVRLQGGEYFFAPSIYSLKHFGTVSH